MCYFEHKFESTIDPAVLYFRYLLAGFSLSKVDAAPTYQEVEHHLSLTTLL